MSWLRALWFAVAVLAISTAIAAGPNGGRLYRNEAMRVHAFEPPPSWQPAPQPNYPRLLIAYTHPDGGRLTLAAQKVAPGTTAEAMARTASPGLTQQGFFEIKIVPERDSAREGQPPRVRLDAKLDAGRRFLKQLYLVDGGLGFVMSLSATSVNQPEMARDFDWAARTLNVGAEAPAHADPDGGVVR